MRYIAILLSMALLTTCAKEPRSPIIDQDVIISALLDIMNTKPDFEVDDRKTIAGCWRSRSSDTIILIGKEGESIALSVNAYGNAVLNTDGSFHIVKPGQDSSGDPFGYLIEGKIHQTKHDTSEFFLRVRK